MPALATASSRDVWQHAEGVTNQSPGHRPGNVQSAKPVRQRRFERLPASCQLVWQEPKFARLETTRDRLWYDRPIRRRLAASDGAEPMRSVAL
jgi:hypothetical protein